MKFLFTGAKGMLASDFIDYLKEEGQHEVMAFSREEMDITDRERVKHIIEENRPDYIIHGAALTNVDLCEENPADAYRINTYGTANVAYYSDKYDSTLVYISSPGLFGDEFKEYNEYDPVGLKTIYARSKYLGEEAVKKYCSKSFIIRPGWLFGGKMNHSKNFVYNRYIEAKSRDVMESTIDKLGCPTYTLHLAKKIMELLKTDYYGTYHITNLGHVTRHEYIKEIIDNFGLETEVKPVTSDKFPRSAPVPDCEVLENMNLKFNGFESMPHWKEAIREYIEKLKIEIE